MGFLIAGIIFVMLTLNTCNMKKLFLGVALAMLSSWTAEAVTLNVKVPEGTKKCYVCGGFNNWDAGGARAMEASGVNMFTLDMPETDAASLAQGYKYLCGQDWLYVEKDASGGEISNRTVAGNPDVVESWRTVPEWSVETVELNINGIPRKIKIYLPDGYENTQESYPVIYYNCLQQRYNNAGDDGDCGDYFFGDKSWNAQTTMENHRAQGGAAYIMVQINSFLAENTIASHPDFMGSGAAETYFKEFSQKLMPYVEQHWRVKTGAESTTIVGADYGALFAIYASVKHPDLFSRCVAMSPMLWINKSEIMQLAAGASASQTYYISAGDLEPQWMRDDSSELSGVIDATGAKCHYTLYSGATHNDDSWGESFGSVLDAMATGSAPVVTVKTKAPSAAASGDFESALYTLYAGPDASNLERIGTLTYTEEYRKNGSAEPVKAQTITYDIPVEYKSKYYWNIACGADPSAGWLFDSPGNIGFSSKKNAVSWHRVALFEDGTSQNTAAHSGGFRVVTSQASQMMEHLQAHTSKGVVKFAGEDKSFKVHFGSVNSASDMGALTPTFTVSDNCLEAEVIYDFELNKVTVNETQSGVNLDKSIITSFTAVPATTVAGSNVSVDLKLDSDCEIELNATRNSNESVGLSFTKVAPGEYHLNIANVKEGIYTLGVSLIAGGNRLDRAGVINVRVLPGTPGAQKVMTVNAYKDVDWATTGRYKANFHTHTSQSFDTGFTTTQVVDKYQAAGYSILALTDHDANPYPWTMFDLYNSAAERRDPQTMGMLAIPGCELSKDSRNNWSESTGGEFNHHTDLFTGRHGQEFMSLRESYAYTEALGGLQIINHPGQYWSLSKEYTPGEKNSPEWHAENFRLYKSLVGLEAYNQGNRRPDDRVLWDQILTLTMPERPVWGFSCDDSHTTEQYFRNYQYVLMPELTADALKDAMRNGNTVFSYEYTGSGKALCPHINSINVDENNHVITIDTDDADNIQWISSFHYAGTNTASRANAASATNTVVGIGKNFDYTGFRGSYVRALLTNKHGETATQPFGFVEDAVTDLEDSVSCERELTVSCDGNNITVSCTDALDRISIVNTAGMVVRLIPCNGVCDMTFSTDRMAGGVYILVASGSRAAYTEKIIVQ